MESQGVVLDTVTPASVIKAAFEAKIIVNGETWMQALDARNKMAHTHNFTDFEIVVLAIRSRYLQLFDALYMTMMEMVVMVSGDA